jgi:hypothetical protein
MQNCKQYVKKSVLFIQNSDVNICVEALKKTLTFSITVSLWDEFWKFIYQNTKQTVNSD